MKSDRALRSQFGLVQWTGPFAFLALVSTGLAAQEYIDVEAERRAAQAAPAPSTGAAVSYGAAAVSAATTTRSLPPPAARATDNIGGLFNQVQQLQQTIPSAHPANVALLRESCNLRRELCRLSQLSAQPTPSSSGATMLPASPSVH